MTVQGTIVIDILAAVLGLMIFQLMRRRVLTVGWGLMWTLPLAGLLVFLNIPSLLMWFTNAVGAKYPVSALSLIGFVFLFIALILLSVQVCKLKLRQKRLIQDVGLRKVLPSGHRHERPSPPEVDTEGADG